MKKGQGMFEYVLLLAGVLLVVVLAIALLRGGLFQSSSTQTEVANCRAQQVTASACYDNAGVWKTTGKVFFGNGHTCTVVLPPSGNGVTCTNDDAVAGLDTCTCGNAPR